MYRFMSFQLKENMSLAPRTRRDDIIDREEFSKKVDGVLETSKEVKPKINLRKWVKDIIIRKINF